MIKFFTILICKVLKYIGNIFGRGSSLPGQIALKIYPNILSKVTLPKYVIAVTGSNGKTSTVEMISHIYKEQGMSVAWNKEGSNQIEGVTTLILSSCNLKGQMKEDILLLEADERYAKYIFNYFTPTHYVVTNLYRDQLTRNGHPEWVFNAIKESIKEDTQLILNADDPKVSLLGYKKNNTIWFGIDKFSESYNKVTGMYNDGYYCPNCNMPMDYNYTHFNHIGSYICSHCNYKKMNTKFTVTDINFKNSTVTINDNSVITISLNSLYFIYNVLAAYAVCAITGVNQETIEKSISSYVLKSGRVVEFTLGKHNGTLLTSKHENSVSYDQSIKIATNYKKDVDVLIIVDAVSRKYFTGETSWLWDINFDLLESENIKNIYLSGTYSYDLATRFSYTNINENKIKIMPSIEEAATYIKETGNSQLFIITCFSDKDKILKHLKIKEDFLND